MSANGAADPVAVDEGLKKCVQASQSVPREACLELRFMNTPAGADGTIEWLPAPTKAGDSVLLRAELDLVLVVSACPQDIVRINDGNPTAVEIELL